MQTGCIAIQALHPVSIPQYYNQLAYFHSVTPNNKALLQVPIPPPGTT